MTIIAYGDSPRPVALCVPSRVAFVLCACLMILIVPFTGISFAVEGEIKGKVVDEETKEALANVNIYLPEYQTGAVTDSDGVFSLPARDVSGESAVVISRVDYDAVKLTLDSVRANPNIVMKKAVRQSPAAITVVAEKSYKILNDIPLTVSRFDESQIQDRGFLDIGDLLGKDAGIFIDGNLAGRKYISIRGSNADEVLVIYDGVKLNSAVDNTVDLSSINLSDIERIEIVKGSNSSLYGTGAFGGVVNITSKKSSDRTLKLQGKYGVRDTYEMNARVSREIGNLAVNGSILRNKFLNEFEVTIPSTNSGSRTRGIENRMDSYSFNTRYRIKNEKLNLKLLRTDFDYDQTSLTTRNNNQFAALGFEGEDGIFHNLTSSLYYKVFNVKTEMESPQFYSSVDGDDGLAGFSLEKKFMINTTSLFFGYELESSEFAGVFRNQSRVVNFDEVTGRNLSRDTHGLVGLVRHEHILKNIAFQNLSLDGSIRVDNASKYGASATYKFGAHLEGANKNTTYRLYLNNGTNVKYPTLNQIFLAETSPLIVGERNLLPERNMSNELGFSLMRTADGTRALDNAGFSLIVFHNSYLYKVYEQARLTGTALFNSPKGSLLGLESAITASMYKGRVSFSLGGILNDISDKRVYLFKPAKKLVADAYMDYRGFNVNFHAYKKGIETALLYGGKGTIYDEFTVPSHYDFNFHARKNFSISQIIYFLDLSLFNIRNKNDTIGLSNLIVHDRRWYVTGGIQL